MQSLRSDVLLFLLMQITIASSEQGQNIGLSNPWTEYVKMLPDVVPLPTMWTDISILSGTSLEVCRQQHLNCNRRRYVVKLPIELLQGVQILH